MKLGILQPLWAYLDPLAQYRMRRVCRRFYRRSAKWPMKMPPPTMTMDRGRVARIETPWFTVSLMARPPAEQQHVFEFLYQKYFASCCLRPQPSVVDVYEYVTPYDAMCVWNDEKKRYECNKCRFLARETLRYLESNVLSRGDLRRHLQCVLKVALTDAEVQKEIDNLLYFFKS